jgi:hypothetical protein
MINLVDEAGALSADEFLELKNFIVDECLCTQVETPWLEHVKIRADGDTGYYGYWTAQWEEIGLDKRHMKAVIVLNATYLKTIEQMKRTLAHEFGHHWTMGYMLDALELAPWWENRAPLDYYRMRGLNLENFAPDYSKDWSHCDKEVLAEDYKYFFSPFSGEHRMKNLVGNPSEEVKAKILDMGLGSRRSWEELIRSRFCESNNKKV